jgi:hypothetical protein
MRIIPMLYTIAVVTPLLAGAQEAVNSSWPLATGSRVRILSAVLGDRKEQGTVVSTTKESIVFQQKSLNVPQTLGVNAISQMDISQGTHSRALKGAFWGLWIGGAVVAGITAATWQKPKDCGFCMDFGRGGDAAMAGVFGGALGAVVGLLVGAMPTETWVPVDIPRT